MEYRFPNMALSISLDRYDHRHYTGNSLLENLSTKAAKTLSYKSSSISWCFVGFHRLSTLSFAYPTSSVLEFLQTTIANCFCAVKKNWTAGVASTLEDLTSCCACNLAHFIVWLLCSTKDPCKGLNYSIMVSSISQIYSQASGCLWLHKFLLTPVYSSLYCCRVLFNIANQ